MAAGAGWDFLGDLKEILAADLARMGYVVNASNDVQEVAIAYFSAIHRRVSPVPRAVHEASGLSCPSEHLAALGAIREKALRGEDLNPHLSRALKDIDYSDVLLNDWGIHHFHLGLNPERDGFVERTGPLLLAIVKPSAIYFLDVLEHGCWALRRLLSIAHYNWPEILEPHRLKGAVDIEKEASEEGIVASRKANINRFVRVDQNLVFNPPGGGFQSDGTSTRVVTEALRLIREVRGLEKHYRENIAEVKRSAQQAGIRSNALRLRLARGPAGDLLVVDETSGRKFLLAEVAQA